MYEKIGFRRQTTAKCEQRSEKLKAGCVAARGLFQYFLRLQSGYVWYLKYLVSFVFEVKAGPTTARTRSEASQHIREVDGIAIQRYAFAPDLCGRHLLFGGDGRKRHKSVLVVIVNFNFCTK